MIAPLAVVALVVVAAGTALVLETLWLDSASVELAGACEAAALAAARELAGDDLLRDEAARERRLDAARRAAADVTARNRVAGRRVVLDTGPEGDVRFGRRVLNTQTGNILFLETSHDPTSVVVRARRTRRGGNPVHLLFGHRTGHPAGDVVQAAEATIDNRVVGVRPFAGVPVPALPLAVLKSDPAGERTDTWDVQIEEGSGEDRYAWDPETRRVVPGRDGLPEIVLRSMPSGGDAAGANVQLVDLGTDFSPERLAEQTRNGWTRDDLEPLGGQLAPGERSPVLTCGAMIADGLPSHLRELVGQRRIVLLYCEHRPQGTRGYGILTCAGLAAGRIMAVRTLPDGACEIVLQPAVVTTRTAVLAEEAPFAAADESRNRYVYKVHLTR